MVNPIIIIPSRLASQRLPNKPLLDIGGKSMIVRVWRCGMNAGIGPVIVACCGPEIEKVITQAGGRAVITDPDLPKGSDRIYAALKEIESQNSDQEYDVIINLQGDLPLISPSVIEQVIVPLSNPAVDIATLAAPILDSETLNNVNVVKVAIAAPQKTKTGEKIGRALYFSRSPIPSGGQDHYHHIGIYAYRRPALETFINLPVSSLEAAEQLEQLRALEAGMRIDVSIVSEAPPSVDTREDLTYVRHILAAEH